MFAGQPEATAVFDRPCAMNWPKWSNRERGRQPGAFPLDDFFIPPIYLIAFLESISQEYGAVSVVEPLFTYWKYEPLDPSRPLESVAKKSYMIPETRTMYGPLGQEHSAGYHRLRQGLQGGRRYLLCLYRLPPYLRYDQDV